MLLRLRPSPFPRCIDAVLRSTRFTPLLRTFATSTRRTIDVWAAGPLISAKTEIPRLHIDQFRALVDKNAANPTHAVGCMAQHKEEMDKFPISEQKEECLRVEVGSTVFQWLLETRRDDLSGTLFCNRAMIQMLCWFLVGQELEDLLWRFLELLHRESNSAVPNQAVNNATARIHLGSGLGFILYALGGLSDAHFEWSDPRSPVPSLLCYKRAVETLGVKDCSEALCAREGKMLIGMKTSLSRIILRDECPPYDENLFNFLFKHIRASDAGVHVEIRAHYLMLYHPHKPDAEPFLQSLQGERSPYKSLGKAKPTNILAFGTSLLRASYILHHQGRHRDAAWLASILQSRVPQIWSLKSRIWDSLDRDEKLSSVRRHGRSISADEIGSKVWTS